MAHVGSVHAVEAAATPPESGRYVPELASMLRACIQSFDMSEGGAIECAHTCGYECTNQCGVGEFSQMTCCIGCMQSCTQERRRQLAGQAPTTQYMVLAVIVALAAALWLVVLFKSHSPKPFAVARPSRAWKRKR